MLFVFSFSFSFFQQIHNVSHLFFIPHLKASTIPFAPYVLLCMKMMMMNIQWDEFERGIYIHVKMLELNENKEESAHTEMTEN